MGKMQMKKIPSDISNYVSPLISDDFKEVVDLANRMVSSDINNLRELRDVIIKLSGYLMYCGTLAGYYSGERRKTQYKTIIDSTGTATDKEAKGKYAAADLRTKEEVFNNLFLSIKNMIDGLKKTFEIKVTEFDKAKEGK
jgi:hypothetical protein